jgi:hypothetical protein
VDDDDEVLIYLHAASPEAIEAAGVARDLVRAKLDNVNISAPLEEFQSVRDGEDVHWVTRQRALGASLVMIAATALGAFCSDDEGVVDRAAAEEFLLMMERDGITI